MAVQIGGGGNSLRFRFTPQELRNPPTSAYQSVITLITYFQAGEPGQPDGCAFAAQPRSEEFTAELRRIEAAIAEQEVKFQLQWDADLLRLLH